jgi:hypothetical protein
MGGEEDVEKSVAAAVSWTHREPGVGMRQSGEREVESGTGSGRGLEPVGVICWQPLLGTRLCDCVKHLEGVSRSVKWSRGVHSRIPDDGGRSFYRDLGPLMRLGASETCQLPITATGVGGRAQGMVGMFNVDPGPAVVRRLDADSEHVPNFCSPTNRISRENSIAGAADFSSSHPNLQRNLQLSDSRDFRCEVRL